MCVLFSLFEFHPFSHVLHDSHVRLRLSKILNTACFLRTNLALIDDFYQRAESNYIFHVYYSEKNCSSLGTVCPWTLTV